MEKALRDKLRKYATAFRDLRDRGGNESDTVMFVVKFLEDVLGWDAFSGEITKEHNIKDRYCDIALKIDGEVRILVECKPASHKDLSDKNIEQAENYGSRSGIIWVLLTNGITWKLYHLSFNETEGITHEVAFSANLLDELDVDADALWGRLEMLSKVSFKKGVIDEFWAQRKVLSPDTLVRVLFTESVLIEVRREINRRSKVYLQLDDVFAGVRDLLSKEALLMAGDINIAKKRRKRSLHARNHESDSEQSASTSSEGDEEANPPDIQSPPTQDQPE